MTDNFLFKYRIKHTLHSCFHILDCLIDNLIQTKVYALLICQLFCHCIRTNVKSDDDRIGCSCQRYVGFVDCTNTAVDHTNDNFFVGQFCQTLFNGFYRTLNVCFNDDRKFFKVTCLNLVKQVIQRKFSFCFFEQMFFIFCNKGSCKALCFFIARECHQDLTCIRNIAETKDLNRCRRTCLFDTSSSVIHHSTDFTAACAGCDEISYMKCTLLYKDRSNRSFTFIKLCLNNKTSCRTVRVCFKFQHFC